MSLPENSVDVDEQPTEPTPATESASMSSDEDTAAKIVEVLGAKEAEESVEEEVQPSTVHPSAAAGTTEEDLAEGRTEYGQYFIGMFTEGKPCFGCPYCSWSTIDGDGSGAVEMHIFEQLNAGNIRHMEGLNRSQEGSS